VEIDVKTVQIVCALLAVSSAGAIVFIRHQYRGLHGLAGWAAGLALIAGGWIIPALPVEAGSIFGAPNIFLAGILAIWLGVRRLNFSQNRSAPVGAHACGAARCVPYIARCRGLCSGE
jgi:hypothetical protein